MRQSLRRETFAAGDRGLIWSAMKRLTGQAVMKNSSVFSERKVFRLQYTQVLWPAPENIWAAVENGAKRIGHGIRVIEEKTLPG